MQRACRAKGLWPGGDLPFLRDRLARSEFGPAALTREDTKTEADAQEEAQRRLYYAVIEAPMDIASIQRRLAEGSYDGEASLALFLADVELMFGNALKYNRDESRASEPSAQTHTAAPHCGSRCQPVSHSLTLHVPLLQW